MKHFLKKKEKKDKYPKVLDIGLEKSNKTIVFRKKQWKIEFTFEDLKNKFNHNKKIIFSFFGIFVLIFLITRYLYLTKAENIEFYPNSCLGGWQNPQNAAGKPDLNRDAPASSFNKNNSAYLSNAISQIYCGNFEGSIPDTNSQIKRAYLTFSWLVLSLQEEQSLISNSSFIQEINTENSSTVQIIDPISNSASDIIIETSTENQTPIETQTSTENQTPTETQTSTESQSSTESQIQTPTEIPSENLDQTETQVFQESEIQTSESQPENTNSNSENSPVINFLPKLLFSKVFAEENLTSTTETQEQTTLNQDIFDLYNTTNTLNLENKSIEEQNQTSALENNLNLESSSTSETSESSSTNEQNLNQDNNQNQIPQDAFLEVLYTLDGENWNILGYITPSNWKDLELDISDINFDNLSNLQISLKSIISDFTPTIYLDGMILNIEYEKEKIVEELNKEELNDLNNKKERKELLKLRKIEKEVEIKNVDNIDCFLDSFYVNIKESETKFVNLKLIGDKIKNLEIGSLPEGIDVVFSENNDYQISTANEIIQIKIYRQQNSSKGDFSLPIIFNSKDSIIICQINIITEN